VIFFGSGVLDGENIHVVVLIEQLLGSCRDAVNLDVRKLVDQRLEGRIDVTGELVGLIKPDLEEQFVLRELALVQVIDDRPDVVRPDAVGAAEDVRDALDRHSTDDFAGAVIVGALVRRELKVEFSIHLVLHQVFLDPLGSLLGEKEIVVAEDDVDDLLTLHRFTEIANDVLDHHEGLPRLLGLADENEAVPFIFIADVSHGLAHALLGLVLLGLVLLGLVLLLLLLGCECVVKSVILVSVCGWYNEILYR